MHRLATLAVPPDLQLAYAVCPPEPRGDTQLVCDIPNNFEGDCLMFGNQALNSACTDVLACGLSSFDKCSTKVTDLKPFKWPNRRFLLVDLLFPVAIRYGRGQIWLVRESRWLAGILAGPKEGGKIVVATTQPANNAIRVISGAHGCGRAIQGGRALGV